MIALLILGLAQVSLPLHMPTTLEEVPIEGARSGAGRDGLRGYRTAERIFADATDIGSNRSNYSRAIIGPARRDACPLNNRCAYHRQFPISAGRKTRLAVAIAFHLSGSGNAACALPGGGDPCQVSLSYLIAGDEVFPRCIRAEPIRRALLRHGWQAHPWLHEDAPASERYRHARDPEMHLFLRTLDDPRCFKSIWIAWLAAPPRPPGLRDPG